MGPGGRSVRETCCDACADVRIRRQNKVSRAPAPASRQNVDSARTGVPIAVREAALSSVRNTVNPLIFMTSQCKHCADDASNLPPPLVRRATLPPMYAEWRIETPRLEGRARRDCRYGRTLDTRSQLHVALLSICTACYGRGTALAVSPGLVTGPARPVRGSLRRSKTLLEHPPSIPRPALAACTGRCTGRGRAEICRRRRRCATAARGRAQLWFTWKVWV
jgi:hypothetical protein